MPTTKDNTTNSALMPVNEAEAGNHSAFSIQHSAFAPAPGTDRAGRVAYYHQLSREAGRVSIMAAVAAGVELHRAKLELAHGNFGLWIKRNCEFGQSTAYKYMNLAESLVCGDGLAALLEDPEPPRVEVLEEHVRPIEARTLTQLYFDLGICKPGKVGGARPGAGRPPGGTSEGRRALTALERSEAARETLEGIVSSLGALINSTQANMIPLEVRRHAATTLKDYAHHLGAVHK